MSKIGLLIIDPQNDFHPGGSLAVAGSNEDSQRIADLIRENLHIDEIFITLDSHHRLHIAHGVCWTNKEGKHPDPFTLINSRDIAAGKWLPVDPNNYEVFLYYAVELEKKGRFQLCIWPEHCLIGTPGHAVVPSINSAVQEWTGKSLKHIHYIQKGMNRFTEMYSAIAAEVPVALDPATLINYNFLDQLNSCEKLIICGQALSHCVNFTTRDIIANWKSSPANLILLSDGCSPVTGFEKEANEFIDFCRSAGVRVITTSDLNIELKTARK